MSTGNEATRSPERRLARQRWLAIIAIGSYAFAVTVFAVLIVLGVDAVSALILGVSGFAGMFLLCLAAHDFVHK
jgi:hypothetical protein